MVIIHYSKYWLKINKLLKICGNIVYTFTILKMPHKTNYIGQSICEAFKCLFEIKYNFYYRCLAAFHTTPLMATIALRGVVFLLRLLQNFLIINTGDDYY